MNRNRIIGILMLLGICCAAVPLLAHPGFVLHCEDIMAVLGLDNNTKLFSRSQDTRNNTSWTKFISSDMIDNTAFHKQLEAEHYNFKISGSRSHRLLFHWAFEAEPWSAALEQKIIDYCDVNDLNTESNLRIFKAKIKTEQKRRNRLILQKTEQTFGLAHGGMDGQYAHFLASMAYNVHILGDYTSGDNHVLEGLHNFNDLAGQFIITLRKIDAGHSQPIAKEIARIMQRDMDLQLKADLLMAYLKESVPEFIQQAQGGNLKRKIEGQGYRFR